MFKRLVIELEQPICDCPQSGFVWKIEGTVENQHGLSIFCRSCGATLVVAPEDLKARITLSRMRAPADKQARNKTIERRWTSEGNLFTLTPATTFVREAQVATKTAAPTRPEKHPDDLGS